MKYATTFLGGLCTLPKPSSLLKADATARQLRIVHIAALIPELLSRSADSEGGRLFEVVPGLLAEGSESQP
jgi:hypothetical protein